MSKKSFRHKIELSQYSSIYLFMFILFLIGLIFGAIIVNSMNFIQKQDLYFYLEQFFGKVVEGAIIQEGQLFHTSFFYHLKYILMIFILGFSIIGIPVIWIFIFMKGIVIGFSVGFLVNQMGWYGFLLAAASIAPQNLLIIPAYLVAGSMAMILSLHLIRKLFATRLYHHMLKKAFTQYVTVYTGLIIVVFGASLIESFVSPFTMKLVVDFIL